MHVLAIRVPSLVNNLTTTISPSLPIGLAYVVAAIEDLVTIETIDAIGERPRNTDVTPYSKTTSVLGLTPKETVALAQKTPDVCLVSSMFSLEWPVTREVINLVREKFPQCIIVGGGEHFSAAPDFSLDHSALDVCVLGEGEATIREFTERLIKEGTLPLDVPGTVVRDPRSKKIIHNARRERIKAVESIRYPAWHLFNVDTFLKLGVGQMSTGGKEHRAFPLAASRGCPYGCTFCSNPQMWGTIWKARPPQDVLTEMKLWKERYGVTHFDFVDLTAIVKKEWILEFTKLLIRENLGITWGLPSGTRSEALDLEVLELLKQSGCNDLDYAPENGSEKILKVMKKMINKDRMLESIRACYKVGINCKANIIFGYPQETRKDVMDTIWFMMRMAFAGMNDVLVGAVSPYPGSKLFEELVAAKKINMDEEYFMQLAAQGSLDFSPSFNNHYSRWELHCFKVGSWALFYAVSLLARPARLWVLLRDLATGNGTTRLSMGLLNIFSRFRRIGGKEKVAAKNSTRSARPLDAPL